MNNIFKKLAAASITTLLASQLLTVPAYASWGTNTLLQMGYQPRLTTASGTTTPVSTPRPTPAPSPLPAPAPVPTTTAKMGVAPGVNPTGLPQEEGALLQLVNQARAANGLRTLTVMPELTRLARLKAQDIVAKNYFDHTSPTYGSFATMVYNDGIRFYSVGENLAQSANAAKGFYQFMGSAPHKANIMNANFNYTGIGIVPTPYGVVICQLFIMQ